MQQRFEIELEAAKIWNGKHGTDQQRPTNQTDQQTRTDQRTLADQQIPTDQQTQLTRIDQLIQALGNKKVIACNRIPQYLQIPIGIFGCNPRPLKFDYCIQDEDVRFVLQSSVRKCPQSPVSLSAWMSGNEICFIQCARHWRNVYISVKGSNDVCCVTSMRDSSIFIVDGIWEDVVEGLSGNIDPIPLSRHGVHEAWGWREYIPVLLIMEKDLQWLIQGIKKIQLQ